MFDVTGRHLSRVPGKLKGYRRRGVLGEPYPAIVQDKESTVDGVVYRNIPESVWDRLDRFEGEMYARRPVNVALNDGTMLCAQTYVIHPVYRNHLDQSDWDFEDFLMNRKADFQKQYKGYSKL